MSPLASGAGLLGVGDAGLVSSLADLVAGILHFGTPWTVNSINPPFLDAWTSSKTLDFCVALAIFTEAAVESFVYSENSIPSLCRVCSRI